LLRSINQHVLSVLAGNEGISLIPWQFTQVAI